MKEKLTQFQKAVIFFLAKQVADRMHKELMEKYRWKEN